MRRVLVALLCSVSMIAASCGGDDDADEETDETSEADESETTEEAEDSEPEPSAEEEEDAPTEEDEPSGDTAGGNIQASGECGLGTGEPAEGDPIVLGGIATNVPGIDFTWITGMTAAYFECVNDNGGINGRPIEYIAEEEQVDPQQIAGLATKLIEEDGALGLVGNTSLIDCSVNADYYESQGFSVIAAGVDHTCFTHPNFSAVNMGPYYSSLGGAQAAVRAGAEGTIVVVSPNQPGFDLVNSGVVDFAEENGFTGTSILEDVPFTDPAGLALRLVNEAGEGGAVVLDFTGPAVVPLLQAIEQQGLIDSVVWASSTPPNDPSVAAELGEAWDGNFLINAEFNVLDSGLPDQNHMNEIGEQYAPDIPSSSFAQMGYLAGRVATDALLSIEGDHTVESVNEAFRGITNFASDMWCKPWYYESGEAGNVSNNADYTVVPEGDNMVVFEDCFDIAELDSEANLLAEIRGAEEAGGLNTGG